MNEFKSGRHGEQRDEDTPSCQLPEVPSRMPQPRKPSASVVAAQAALIHVPALPLGALASRAMGIDGADLDAEAVVEQRDEDTPSCRLPDVPSRMPQPRKAIWSVVAAQADSGGQRENGGRMSEDGGLGLQSFRAQGLKDLDATEFDGSQLLEVLRGPFNSRKERVLDALNLLRFLTGQPIPPNASMANQIHISPGQVNADGKDPIVIDAEVVVAPEDFEKSATGRSRCRSTDSD